MVAAGVTMLIVVAGLGVLVTGTLTPPLADADTALGLPDRIAAPSPHLRVSDTPGLSAAVIGVATHRTRLGEETLPVVVSGIDGSAHFVRLPGVRDVVDMWLELSLSPDGRYLAYQVDAAEPTLVVLDLIDGGSQPFSFPETIDGLAVGAIRDVAWSTTPGGDRLVWGNPRSAEDATFSLPVFIAGNLATGEVQARRLRSTDFPQVSQGADKFAVVGARGTVDIVDEVSDLAGTERIRSAGDQQVLLNYLSPVVDPQMTRIALPGKGVNEDGYRVLTGRFGGQTLDLERVKGVRADRLRGWRGDGLVGEGLDGEAPVTPEVIQRLDLETGEVTDLVDIEVAPESVQWAATAWEGDLIEVADESPLPLVVRDGILITLLLGGGLLVVVGIRRRRDLP